MNENHSITKVWTWLLNRQIQVNFNLLGRSKACTFSIGDNVLKSLSDAPKSCLEQHNSFSGKSADIQFMKLFNLSLQAWLIASTGPSEAVRHGGGRRTKNLQGVWETRKRRERRKREESKRERWGLGTVKNTERGGREKAEKRRKKRQKLRPEKI